MSALSPEDRARLTRDIADLVSLGFISPVVDPKLLPDNEISKTLSPMSDGRLWPER